MGNFAYFAWMAPFTAALCAALALLRAPRWRDVRLGLMVGWVWLGRLALTWVDVGSFPAMKPDVPFYATLAACGAAVFVFYVRVGEGRTLASLPWGADPPARQLVAGALFLVGTLAIYPTIVMAVTGIRPATLLPSWQAVAVGLCFGLPLGGFLEEGLFRGVLLERMREALPGRWALVAQAAVFCVAHVGYLPGDGYGVFYVVIFVLGFVWGRVRANFGLLAAVLAHGGFVAVTVPPGIGQ